MDAAKYNRNITLLCPTCGNAQFEDDGNDVVRCASCKREITKDQLIRENSENVSMNVEEMGREIVEDFTKELKNKLSGIKGLTIR